MAMNSFSDASSPSARAAWASIALPVSVHPEDLLQVSQDWGVEPAKGTATATVLSVLHLAWTVMVRRWAGSDTFYIGGDYQEGACYVHDRALPNAKMIDLAGDETLRELSERLATTMAMDVSSQAPKATSRSHGSYSATICYPGDPRPAIPKIPATSLRLDLSSATQDQWLVQLRFDETSLSTIMAASLLHSFNQTLLSITEAGSTSLDAVNLCAAPHLAQLREYTKHVSPYNNTMLHDMCLHHAKTTPNAPAIESWDGNLTYAQLDDLTTRLAHHLIAHGAGRNRFVLNCFPKSTWAIVGRLAILKSGSAYIAIEASDPPSYLESIIARTNTQLMITAPEYAAHFRKIVPSVIEVTPASVLSLPIRADTPCPDAQPDDPCLILFTSGSTGTPKGIIQEHRSYATAIADYVKVLGLDHTSRVLQFDDYAFDISNNDYLAPLTVGGCCCVPTPEKTITALRQNINALRATMTFLTPTVAIQVGPHDMPTLRTVCIGGEPPSRDLLAMWRTHSHIRLINQYGMGEAATFCAYNDHIRPENNSIVGRAGSGAIWIASPADPGQLLPIGAVGEILIEGPHLARGYLDHVAARSSSSDAGFLPHPPAWMHALHPHRSGAWGGDATRVYRTGDLGRYHVDGTVEHLGRKDTVLKLNGCRVDSIEVESVLRQCLQSPEDAVVVDVLGVMGENEEPVLTAFVYRSGPAQKPGVDVAFQVIDEKHQSAGLVQRMHETLGEQLPAHMVPGLFLAVDRVPRTKSNKTDRRRLRMLGQEWYMGNISPSTRGEY